MNSKCGTLIGLALLTATTLMGTGASAQDLLEDSMDVRFVTSDLRTMEGTARLYQRIQSAAKRVCHEPAKGEWAGYKTFRHCVDVAVEDAVKQIHSPALTTLHRSKAPQFSNG